MNLRPPDPESGALSTELREQFGLKLSLAKELYRKSITMTKNRITIKDKKLKALLKKGGRKGAKKDFFELLKRSVNPA